MSIHSLTGCAACIAALIGGCATTPGLDAGHGKSLEALKASQTREPAAALQHDNQAMDVVDGPAASNAIDRYHRSFATPPTPMNIINIGTSAGSSAAR